MLHLLEVPELRTHYWWNREEKIAQHQAGFKPTTSLSWGARSTTVLQPCLNVCYFQVSIQLSMKLIITLKGFHLGKELSVRFRWNGETPRFLARSAPGLVPWLTLGGRHPECGPVGAMLDNISQVFFPRKAEEVKKKSRQDIGGGASLDFWAQNKLEVI